MAARRTVILIAAVVVAAIAAVAVYSYLTTVQDRANKDAKLVKVFVVKKDITKGLPGEQALDQGFIKPDKINVKFRAATALTDVNVIRGRVALTNLAANQVVVDGQFVDPKVATLSSAQRIPTGNVADIPSPNISSIEDCGKKRAWVRWSGRFLLLASTIGVPFKAAR